ncbi:hypothetical protein FRB94_003775 [Tulasnella sp. JGI-2019a]|nr:hypothetical protein FRB94_003775 [Tulasnella sp. JGI-2019a]
MVQLGQQGIVTDEYSGHRSQNMESRGASGKSEWTVRQSSTQSPNSRSFRSGSGKKPSNSKTPYRRRGSESSDGSSASSSFLEYFSSSSSRSEGHPWAGVEAPRINDQGLSSVGRSSPCEKGGIGSCLVCHSHPLTHKVVDMLHLGRTQREIKRLVDAFLNKDQNPTHRPTVAFTDAAAGLLNLSDDPRSKADIIRRLSKGATTLARTLSALFDLANSEADSITPLKGSSLAARLMILVMGVPKMGQALAIYLANHGEFVIC